VNDHDYNSLFASLNLAVDILHRNRTPDPAFVAAYDTLKQSRAMIEKVLHQPVAIGRVETVELAA
jgi:hypothetical protein